MLSTHKVEVVEVKLEKHPNADALSVVSVFGGFPCCVRTADWKDGDLAAYVPPDSVVDVSRPEFAFLAKGEKQKHRVRAVKLRGVQSFGLLVPAPAGAKVGDDVSAAYGVEHYEPEMRGLCTGGEAEQAPGLLSLLAKYDVDSLRRYSRIFEAGEDVHITEKIHGANARYSFAEGRMWCGSRAEWKRQEQGNIWWRALEVHPEIEAFCRSHPCHVLYGEVYGKVQGLRYGVPNDVRFMAFDVLGDDGKFWDAGEFREVAEAMSIPMVPLLDVGPFNFQRACLLAEGPSTVPGADHVREGCVVRPLRERWHQAVGRVCLKVVGAGYLEKS